jgi:hypothetical protein
MGTAFPVADSSISVNSREGQEFRGCGKTRFCFWVAQRFTAAITAMFFNIGFSRAFGCGNDSFSGPLGSSQLQNREYESGPPRKPRIKPRNQEAGRHNSLVYKFS